jgi:three-Cys-motif partner protein
LAANKRVAHRFGGVWTEIKLRALTEYLDFYSKALKNQGFETWYIDAFAGTGDRHAELEHGGIFEGQPIEQVELILDGSARKALKIDPPFKHYWFVEQHRGRAAALKALMSEFSLDIQIRTGEANAELRALFASAPWCDSPKAGRQRAVVFLDPYGMSVDWETLAMLASSRRVDVWYLFPRKAVVQQLARDIRGVDAGKRGRLAQIFGSTDWEDEFYRSRPAQGSFFDAQPEETKDRVATPAQISAFARKQLGNLFCYVSDPLPLVVKGSDFFELYCLSNNARAIPLIRRGVEHVMRKYTPASRRTYGP